MEAILITVSPTQRGWLLLEGERIAEVLSNRFWALKAADALAHQRFRETGQPTTVVERTNAGEISVASRYE
ncbi:MAG TPA: hypothetical protein VGD42_08740 [Lysobacter sp.]